MQPSSESSAVIAVAGGWYLFIPEDAELATNAPAIPSDLVDATATATATTAASGDATVTASPTEAASGDVQTFAVLADRSEAAYFVDEELASIGLPSTAKGSTTAFTGTFYLAPHGISLDPGQTSVFTVDLTRSKATKTAGTTACSRLSRPASTPLPRSP